MDDENGWRAVIGERLRRTGLEGRAHARTPSRRGATWDLVMSPLAREILGGGVPSRTCSIFPTGKRRWARAARVSSGETGTVRRLCVVHALRRLLGVLRACQGAVGCRGRKRERAGRKRGATYFTSIQTGLESGLACWRNYMELSYEASEGLSVTIGRVGHCCSANQQRPSSRPSASGSATCSPSPRIGSDRR